MGQSPKSSWLNKVYRSVTNTVGCQLSSDERIKEACYSSKQKGADVSN